MTQSSPIQAIDAVLKEIWDFWGESPPPGAVHTIQVLNDRRKFEASRFPIPPMDHDRKEEEYGPGLVYRDRVEVKA